MKQRKGDGVMELTVRDYFVKHRNISLLYSADYPCIDVGQQRRPTYIPIEVVDGSFLDL